MTNPKTHIKFGENEMQVKTRRIALLNSQIADTPDTAPKDDLNMNTTEDIQTQNEQQTA